MIDQAIYGSVTYHMLIVQNTTSMQSILMPRRSASMPPEIMLVIIVLCLLYCYTVYICLPPVFIVMGSAENQSFD